MLNKVRARDILHGEEPLLTIRHHFIERDQVGMDNIGETAKFALKPIERFGILLGFIEGLEGDNMVGLEILRLINDTKPTRANTALHLKTGCSGENVLVWLHTDSVASDIISFN